MSDESSEKPKTPHNKVWGTLRETLGKAGEVAGETARKGELWWIRLFRVENGSK